MMNREQQIEQLQVLLDRSYDSYQGYSKAAENVEEKALKLFLFNVSLERKDNSMALSQIITDLGGTPDDSGTLKGAAHRTWFDLKSMMMTNTEEVIIEECLRGEEKLVEDYMSVLKEADFPKNIENMLARQLGTVQSRIKKLETLAELETA